MQGKFLTNMKYRSCPTESPPAAESPPVCVCVCVCACACVFVCMCVVRDLYENEVGIGRCTMLGVRDLCRPSQRCSNNGAECEAAEHDMVDMFWALPKEEVLRAFEWGVG